MGEAHRHERRRWPSHLINAVKPPADAFPSLDDHGAYAEARAKLAEFESDLKAAEARLAAIDAELRLSPAVREFDGQISQQRVALDAARREHEKLVALYRAAAYKSYYDRLMKGLSAEQKALRPRVETAREAVGHSERVLAALEAKRHAAYHAAPPSPGVLALTDPQGAESRRRLEAERGEADERAAVLRQAVAFQRGEVERARRDAVRVVTHDARLRQQQFDNGVTAAAKQLIEAEDAARAFARRLAAGGLHPNRACLPANIYEALRGALRGRGLIR